MGSFDSIKRMIQGLSGSGMKDEDYFGTFLDTGTLSNHIRLTYKGKHLGQNLIYFFYMDSIYNRCARDNTICIRS